MNVASYTSNTVGGAGHNDILGVPFVSLTESYAEYLLHSVGATNARVHARQFLPVDAPHM